DLARAGGEIERWQILLNRFEEVDARACLDRHEGACFLMMEIEHRPLAGIDLEIVALKIVWHPDVAVFIPGEERVGLAAFAPMVESSLEPVAELFIRRVFKAVGADIASCDKSRSLMFGKIFGFECA